MFVLPTMEQQPLYNSINFSFMWGTYQICNWGQGLGAQNLTVRQTVINSLLCPSDPSPRDRHEQLRRGLEPTGGGDLVRRQRRR